MPNRRFVASIALAALASCATNPVTGKSELSLISEAQEIEMGRQAAQEARQSMGVVPDSGLQQYVRSIGLKIAATTERPNLPWSFDVIDDAAVNAFALPGGFIFVTRGILGNMTNEAELASVLGHEIGHVTAKHSVHQMSRAQVAQLGLGIGSILNSNVAAIAGIASQGLGLLFLKFGRDDETQADDLGFRYALNNNWDVRQMRDMFQMLQRVSSIGGEQGRLPQWLSTHPDPENRIAKTEQRLATVTRDLSGTVVNQDRFLREIDGIVYGENPRAGYFDGGRFNHPDLQFRIDFPSGWQTQNQAAAVAAGSPNNDAIFVLSVPSKESPDVALGKFLGQQGIQAGTPARGSLNGFPAAAADFQAATQDGQQIAGRITYVSFGGSTYQLLGYSTAAAFGNYRGTFQQVAQSFNRLTDPAALNKQPKRVRVVTVPRDMTVAQFNQQYPSAVPVEIVAMINDKAGPNEVLKGGSRAKRVE
jgi:predicted Zn-dependent protease